MLAVAIVVVVVIGILIYVFGKEKPVIGPDGKITGNYSVSSIEALGKPYQCSFSKSDATSQVSGVMRMAEGKLRGDFDITTSLTNTATGQNLPNTSFASHFIIMDGTSYIWTSIRPFGLKAPAAKSATSNASPEEQAQIVGTNDKIDYTCSPWNADLSVFDLPSGISFSELK